MNYPTAEKAAIESGALIAREAWKDIDGNSTKWLTYERGAFYLYTSSVRKIVEIDDLAEADFRALDWHFPQRCEISVSAKPDFGGISQATAPTFDIKNPPCSVS